MHFEVVDMKAFFVCNILATITLLSMGAAADYAHFAPKSVAPPAQRNVKLEKEVLNDLYFELNFHLTAADAYLRSLINCFEAQPITRANQKEPMYTEAMTCAQARAFIGNEIKEKFSKMRVELALSSRGNEFVANRNPVAIEKYYYEHPELASDRFNKNPQHPFSDLAKLAPLSPTEIEMGSNIWNKVSGEALFENSLNETAAVDFNKLEDDGFEMVPRSIEKATPAEMTKIWKEEDAKFSKLAASRYDARVSHLENYKETLGSLPILGFLSKAEVNNAEILRGLSTLLVNNCTVRVVKFSTLDLNRHEAKKLCTEKVESLNANYTNLQTGKLAKEAALAVLQESDRQFNQQLKLNWRKATKDLESFDPISWQRHDILYIFNLHPAIVDGYIKRFPNDKARAEMVRELKSEFSSLDLKYSGAEMAGYVALGVVCTVGVRRVPLGREALAMVVRKWGIPVCLFATGLPLNMTSWFWGEEDYLNRFSEVYSTPPGQQAIQSLKEIESAQLATQLNFLFMGIGTGLPELKTVLVPTLRNRFELLLSQRALR